MKMKLAENIRNFRKQHSLTQEQLAEVLGVTVGAVYKWEAKLSQPELSMIVAIANFFDTSVDVLLGYEIKDNRLQTSLDNLKKCLKEKNKDGLTEAEKALKKYPNDFNIVHKSASIYHMFGMELQNKEMLLRALELLKKSQLLLSQNTDPEISNITLYGEIANVYLALNESEKAVELLKKHNAGDIYSDMIGFTLAGYMKHTDEAIPYLSEALLNSIVAIIRIITGYVNVYFHKEDYNLAHSILLWGINVLTGLQSENKISFLDKSISVFHVCIAYTQIKNNDNDAAIQSLRTAKALAKRFDESPNYTTESLIFFKHSKSFSAYDNIGATAIAGIENVISSIEDDELKNIWSKINKNEE